MPLIILWYIFNSSYINRQRSEILPYLSWLKIQDIDLKDAGT